MGAPNYLGDFKLTELVKPSKLIRYSMSFPYDDPEYPGYYDAENNCYSISGEFLEHLARYIEWYYEEREEDDDQEEG